MKPISRASGRSAVAAAAYRAGIRLVNERDGGLHDYTAKRGIAHAEIVLPKGSDAGWARDRSHLWNEAERCEHRKDARVAREIEISLPHELSAQQRLELTRAFARHLADHHGAAVDFAIHIPHDEMDVRNHHAHLLMTTRVVTAAGLGEKTHLERQNKWLVAQGLATTSEQLKDLRSTWECLANAKLAAVGLDVRVDHRSHLALGLEIEPTRHVGVHATEMKRAGLDITRARSDEEAFRHNAEVIREKPDQVLTLITYEKSVFDRRDVARALHRYIDDVPTFQSAFAAVVASPLLVELCPERKTEAGRVEPARWSTRAMVEIERGLSDAADRLKADAGHRVAERRVHRAIARQDEAIRKAVASDCADRIARGEMTSTERDRRVAKAGLSLEQRHAIEHVTGPARIAIVIGFAGAGKSTMLAAAREAWEGQGHRVFGAALAGKAAEGLEESAGIRSRTLASWERRWERGLDLLAKGDVFVVDEAGMIGSRQLAGFVGAVERCGAKIVLVGDHEQLQAIAAGAPFRAIAERIGHVELVEIRRQRVDWQREASVAFATHRTVEGLAAYAEHGAVRIEADRESARGSLVRDYLADLDVHPGASRVAMAHRRVDVRALNDEIRSSLQARGVIASGVEAGEREFDTNDGRRSFSVADRVVFLENSSDLGVKNGMLGTVTEIHADRLVVAVDGRGGEGIVVPIETYRAVDHGYATTVHKNQGATVDRAFVLASETMDRHLTYVAMTRHRDEVRLYAGADAFRDARAGRLVAHGAAPYQHDGQARDSYFVTLEVAGTERTIWGVDLARAMAATKPEIGECIRLDHTGKEPIVLPNGTAVERNDWKIERAGDLVIERLGERLARAGIKETTLDYGRDFADRRGIAERFGVASEIVVSEKSREAPARIPMVGDLVPRAPIKAASMDEMFGELDRGMAPPTWAAAIERAREHVVRDLALAFREPQDVLARLDELIARRQFEAVQGEIDKVSVQPTLAGGLKGATGWFGKVDETRAVAQLALSRLTKIGVLFDDARRFIEGEYRNRISAANVRGARAVPMPSLELQAALREHKPITGELATEIIAIRRAIDLRFTPEERHELWSGDVERIGRVVPEGTDVRALQDLAAPIEMRGRDVESQAALERHRENKQAEEVAVFLAM